jgi:hypothetical protein
MVRRGSLKLSHWHLPLQLRPVGPKVYSTQEEDLCGGQDETAVASATNSEAERGWAKAVGPGLSVDSRDHPNSQAKSKEGLRGGEPCE